ncbi:MAG: serine aminopeptidase domain-containing protein [Rhodococcus sp. (in: high G+C Gram-positive bacteria)]
MSNEPTPVLRAGRRMPDPALVVLVLGGGKDVSRARSRPWHLAGLRMWPFTWMLRRAGRSRDISVQQLQYRFRGWNAPERTAVEDARWALSRIHAEHPDVHVVVVGHSMGGRTAAALIDDPSIPGAEPAETTQKIVGVVALAPWWPEGAEADAFGPQHSLLVVHGTADRWTDPRTSRAATERAAEAGAAAHYVSVPGGHFMLRNPGLWSRATCNFVLGIADARTDCVGRQS